MNHNNHGTNQHNDSVPLMDQFNSSSKVASSMEMSHSLKRLTRRVKNRSFDASSVQSIDSNVSNNSEDIGGKRAPSPYRRYNRKPAAANPQGVVGYPFNSIEDIESIPDRGISEGAKILVVEDSPAQRKMLVQRLNKADASWDVSFAVSGEDALQKLKAAKLIFDVVFVDENLSAEDGLFGHELVHIMRDSFKMTHCVIIACTSNASKNEEVTFFMLCLVSL
jgi:CheY-like chemotaxis protein